MGSAPAQGTRSRVVQRGPYVHNPSIQVQPSNNEVRMAARQRCACVGTSGKTHNAARARCASPTQCCLSEACRLVVGLPLDAAPICAALAGLTRSATSQPGTALTDGSHRQLDSVDRRIMLAPSQHRAGCEASTPETQCGSQLGTHCKLLPRHSGCAAVAGHVLRRRRSTPPRCRQWTPAGWRGRNAPWHTPPPNP